MKESWWLSCSTRAAAPLWSSLPPDRSPCTQWGLSLPTGEASSREQHGAEASLAPRQLKSGLLRVLRVTGLCQDAQVIPTPAAMRHQAPQEEPY